MDGYALLGLRAGFSGRRWEVFADLRNLFDEEYIATLSVLNVAAPARACCIRARRYRPSSARGCRSRDSSATTLPQHSQSTRTLSARFAAQKFFRIFHPGRR